MSSFSREQTLLAVIVNGAIAPIVALKLVTLDTREVIFDSEGLTASSRIQTRSAAGVESVVIDARFSDEKDGGARIQLSWASPGQGQLPADPTTLNILALKPYGWNIEVDGFEGFPCDSVHCRTSFTNSQIYNFRRAAAAAEYEQRFASTTPRWTDSGGDWTTQSGYYTNTANVAFTRRVLASSSDGTLPVGFWGTLSVSRVDGVLRVIAPAMSQPYLTVAQQARGGDVGVIASWNLMRFDDVVFSAQNGPN